jgi:hypothetical protein
MSIAKAVSVGLAGNELSKTITGTSEVGAGRTVVATGSGAILGGAAAGAITVGVHSGRYRRRAHHCASGRGRRRHRLRCQSVRLKAARRIRLAHAWQPDTPAQYEHR